VRGWGQGGEMNQALYAHMNNKRKTKRKKKKKKILRIFILQKMQKGALSYGQKTLR
jgi:hypothetical protein